MIQSTVSSSQDILHNNIENAETQGDFDTLCKSSQNEHINNTGDNDDDTEFFHTVITPQPIRIEHQQSPISSSQKNEKRTIIGRRNTYTTSSRRRCSSMLSSLYLVLLTFILLLPQIYQRDQTGMIFAEAGNYNGYYYNYYNNNGNKNQNNDDASNTAGDDGNAAAGDDGNAAAGDDNAGAATDDGTSAAATDDAAGNNAAADDAVEQEDNAAAAQQGGGNDDYAGDDYYGADDDATAYNGDDNAYNQANQKDQQSYQYSDDDVFHWNENVGFGGVSLMPLSCVNYNSGHMIKFQLYDSEKSKKCRFAEISTFVVSISHFMRAYFNYQALTHGQDFRLPDDAAYLNCLQLQETTPNGIILYAKVGCMQRETFTSTRLQLHLYTDAQCSQHYDDGQTSRMHSIRGYNVGSLTIPTRVSFRPEFYSCMSCAPDQVSYTFNKRNSNWYDDDYIGKNGNNNKNSNSNSNSNSNGNNGQTDDGSSSNSTDDTTVDDQYYTNNDDYKNYQNDDSNRYRRDRLLAAGASEKDLKAYHDSFWAEYEAITSQQKHNRDLSDRSLYENYYDIGDWNMCQRLYKYGVWCDEECRALDFFRANVWSASDIFLLVIMCLFMTAMLLLIIAKRLKAQQKARLYGDDHPVPGLPPCAMAIIFLVVISVIIFLAKVRFINETLVFAVVTCVLLFIYMLKLTLFESRRPILLAAPRHDVFDNPLDNRLFD